uniref:Fe2OG dioxygenase domain-containing protein n=1 Tax=Romanomermis culicivorax TaxID=13658 RepID=A0A915KS98_ROMCU
MSVSKLSEKIEIFLLNWTSARRQIDFVWYQPGTSDAMTLGTNPGDLKTEDAYHTELYIPKLFVTGAKPESCTFYIPQRVWSYLRIILKLLLIVSAAFFLYVLFNPSIRRYPLWWWFLPYERWLCDQMSTPFRGYFGDPEVLKLVDQSALVCFYLVRHRLYRYKIERLYADPDVTLIYDLSIDQKTNDFLIAYTKTYSTPSPVYTLFTSSDFERWIMESLDFRTSNSEYIERFRIPGLYNVAGRAVHMNVDNLDGQMNVLWYRRRGHIIPHHDVYPYSDSPKFGRRFATLIVYFVNPTNGGATILPDLGLATKPPPNSALLFFNTLTDNEPDPKLTHAGCPVWSGEKIIGTFWFRQFFQEFWKPCPKSARRFKLD